LGPPKGKRERDAPFDPVLQEAIKKLWEENGRHEFVFGYPDGSIPWPSWISGRFPKWLRKAGIELKGRKIVPHSARHSLASLLEERGVSLRTYRIYWDTRISKPPRYTCIPRKRLYGTSA